LIHFAGLPQSQGLAATSKRFVSKILANICFAKIIVCPRRIVLREAIPHLLQERHSMKVTAKSCLLLFLIATIALPLSADEKKKGKKKQQGNRLEAQILKRFSKAELSAEQTTKLKALVAEHGPKIAAATKKAVVSKEQKQARAAAMKKAKADGKKGKELRAAVNAAAPLNAEQTAAAKEVASSRAALMTAAVALLSDEQKAKAGIKQKKSKKKKKKDQ